MACATVETFQGCLAIMKSCKPEVVILENVPKIDSSPSDDELLGSVSMFSISEVRVWREKVGITVGNRGCQT